MKAGPENLIGMNTNPFIIDQLSQPKENDGFKEKPLGINPETSTNKTNISLQDSALKYIKYAKGYPFFKEEAFTEMTTGIIPNFEELYDRYLEIKPKDGKLLPAIHLLPALRNFSLAKKDIANLLKNPEPKHILVQNDQIKIIVIRWQPGDQSDIHGHAVGGGLIKVLYGAIKEKRFSADSQQQLLSESTYFTDHIAYIDDVMGLHSVENDQDSPAMTLHIYTPGNHMAKKYE